MASIAGRVILGTLGTIIAAIPTAYVLKEQKVPGFASRVHAAALPWGRSNEGQYLQGRWKNELGSVVELEQMEDGRIIGKYRTAVESEEGAAGDQPRRLYGNSSLTRKNPTFGFTVVWRESSTSWSGQYFNEKGEERLLTTWILTSKQDSISDNWQAFRVGSDRFKRIK